MPEFKQTITNDESFISQNDEKIDTNDVNEEEKEQQGKAEDEMNNISNDDINADTSGEEDEETDDAPDEGEKAEDTSDKSDEENEDKNLDDFLEDEQDDKSSDETQKGKFDGFDTFEEYKQHIADEKANTEKQSVDYNKIENSDLSNAEKQKQVFETFYEKHSNILPESVKDNYLKFFSSGNNAFLHIDNHLHKLSEALSSLRVDLPFSEKLEKAVNIAFSSEIASKEQKKGEAKAEIRAQKVNKAVGNSTNTTSKTEKSNYSKGQLWAAKKMEVKLN